MSQIAIAQIKLAWAIVTFLLISIQAFVPFSKDPISFSLPLQISPIRDISRTGKGTTLHECRLLTPEQELTLANIPPSFNPLFRQALLTTMEKAQVTDKGAHDSFRFEWGTWVDEPSILELMRLVDQVRIRQGAFEKLYAHGNTGTSANKNENAKADSCSYRIASGNKWECNIHALPVNTNSEIRHPTGSWSILKALTGVVEVAMLRPDREGNFKKAVKKDLRGGSDGSFGVVGGGGGGAIHGANCIKYVGGPPRNYMGKSDRTILLEFVIRPPIAVEEAVQELPEWEDLEGVLEVVEILEEENEEDVDTTENDQENSKHESAQQQAQSLGKKLGMNFDKVGGLDSQLDAIVRRVLASRANPAAARRLGISHVRGILLSGPPGCGKTLLARELARLLGAREPQIVNGPEILDKFIGEAEKRVRDLFVPAEMEWNQVGEDSALHIIILDEMDAIARKRGSVSSDTTGVRDSVVNQLLAKMDGVKEANNVLVVGLTNRPELLDPALLRPGRLEVQLRVELPDIEGRRDIFRIHTRQMKGAGGLSPEAEGFLEDLSDKGLPALSDKYTGAEIAGLVRSAASFALARAVQGIDSTLKDNYEADGERFLNEEEGRVSVEDFVQALGEVRPALGNQDELLQMRFPMGISSFSPSMERVLRDLKRFIAPINIKTTPRLHSMLLVGEGNGGAGVTALAAWAAAEASKHESADYVRFITALDLLTGSGSGGNEARAAALVDRVSEATEMPNSLLVLDDVDQLCAGSGPHGYCSIMISTLRALLRSPPNNSQTAKAGGHSLSKGDRGKTIHIIATSSRSDAACRTLHELFEETVVVPLLTDIDSIEKLLLDSGVIVDNVKTMASLISQKKSNIGCKEVLRLAERSVAAGAMRDGGSAHNQIKALELILEDLHNDEISASKVCAV